MEFAVNKKKIRGAMIRKEKCWCPGSIFIKISAPVSSVELNNVLLLYQYNALWLCFINVNKLSLFSVYVTGNV